MVEEQKNTMHDMMKSSYGSEKADKSNELNANMSITNQGKDEYENKIHNVGGNS